MNIDTSSEINDPILNYLEKIKTEYRNFKHELNEKNNIIRTLKKTINSLENKLSTIKIDSHNIKRRKTSSIDSGGDDGSTANISGILISPEIDKSIDTLNTALSNDNFSDDNDTFIPPNQVTPSKPTKKSTSSNNNNENQIPRKVLSPCNRITNEEKDNNKTPIKKTSPNQLLQLPRRAKSIARHLDNNENKNLMKNNNGWISKKRIKKNLSSAAGMSFIQPARISSENLNSSNEGIACSQEISSKPKREKSTFNFGTNTTTSTTAARMKQSKLEFDIKTANKKERKSNEKNMDDETFCEDYVAASPTCTNITTCKDLKILRTTRKIPRQKSDDDLFVFPIKKPICSVSLTSSGPLKISKPSTSAPANVMTSEKDSVKPKKAEPIFTLNEQRKFFEHMKTEDDIDELSLDYISEDESIKKSLKTNVMETVAKKSNLNEQKIETQSIFSHKKQRNLFERLKTDDDIDKFHLEDSSDDFIIENVPKTNLLSEKKEITKQTSQSTDETLPTIKQQNSSNNLTNIDSSYELDKNKMENLLDNDTSLFIIPSQPDDVILVEDTEEDVYNLSSMDLLAEMLRNDKETQPLLKKFEVNQIKSLQSSDESKKPSTSSSSTIDKIVKLEDKQITKTKPIEDNIKDELVTSSKLSEMFDDLNDFTNISPEKPGFHHDCEDCQKYKKYLISIKVPSDEIERRLRTCKRPRPLHHTPDGFWDPRFREFPPDDPRNEVLIDYRFVDKKRQK